MTTTATLTGVTQGGLSWLPKFIKSINKDTCLGCGKCFKVCGRNVLTLQPVNEFGEFFDEDEDDDDIVRQVMTIANPQNCIGCEACFRICPKKCQSHEALGAV